jgi:hypothetical protein
MIRLRPRLPSWTAHPGFGVAALFAIAVLLIVHGEPQPSSRPSGKSVVVSGSPSPATDLPATMIVHGGILELHRQSGVRRITLPDHARPTSVLASGGLNVVLSVLDGRQRAYAITKNLAITDLGFADAVLPAAGKAAVLVEAAIGDPGRLSDSQLSPSATVTSSPSSSARISGPPPLRDYLIRRYDSSAHAVGAATALPTGMRAGADTNVGLVVWQPASRVFDGPIALEPLSARAVLLRTNGSQRPLGALYPLAATAKELLVWDVQGRRFGLMPLHWLTSTATTTASPSPSSTPTTGSARPKPEATATPTAVAGTRWFDHTRGFTVTGPAAFSQDGSSFAVYAQVGARRRLVVAQAGALPGNQIEVLALTPSLGTISPSASAAATGTARTTLSATSSASPSPTPSLPVFAPDGFPITAPSTPLWTAGQVIGVGSDGTVVSYTPGGDQAALLDLGVKDLESLAAAA